MKTEVLMFDVGGTVFDWNTAILTALDKVDFARNGDIDKAKFSELWREKSIMEMYEIARLETPWRPFNGFINTSLDYVLSINDVLSISQDDRTLLRDAWRRMPTWPGARESLAKLREKFFITPHTIIGLSEIAFSSKRAGISWDSIVSCDALGVTKTNPESYSRGLDVLGVSAEQVCYVAAHPVDLRAAKQHGMQTAYIVAQLHDYGDEYDDTGFSEEFTYVAEDFADLANKLG